MADVKYSVEIAYFTSGSVKSPFAPGGAASGEKVFKGYDRGLSVFTSKMSNAFSGMVDGFSRALLGGAESAVSGVAGLLEKGISAALKDGISFADTMERTQIALASMQHMHMGVSFEAGMRSSAQLMEQARIDAAALPGEFKDIVGTMKAITPSGLQAGMTMEQIEKMSARAIALAESEGVSTKVAASQLAMMLDGRMTNRQAFGRNMGFRSQELNAMKPEDRVKAIESQMQKGDPAIESYKNSWAGLTSSVRDNLRNVAKSFATPLFDSMKLSMHKGLEWFQANQQRIHTVAAALGTRLRSAFEYGQRAIIKWGPPLFNFTEHLYQELSRIFKVIEPFLVSAGNGIKSFLNDPNSIKRLEHAAELLVGVLVGGKILSGLGGMLAMVTPLLSGGGGAAAAGLVALAPELALAAGAVALAGVGIAEAMNTNQSWIDDAMKASVDSMKGHIEGAAKSWSYVYKASVKPALEVIGLAFVQLGEVTAALVHSLGSSLESLMRSTSNFEARVVDFFGANKSLPLVAKPDETFDTTTGKLRKLLPGETQGSFQATGDWKDVARRAWNIATGQDPSKGNNAYTYMNGDTNQGPDRVYEPPPSAFIKEILPVIAEAKKAKDPPNIGINIHNVEIKVNSNQDPFRVAQATLKVLNEVARNPKVSRAAGAGVSR